MSGPSRFLTLVLIAGLIASCDASVPPSRSVSPSTPSPSPVGQPLTLWMLDMPGLAGVDVAAFAPPHLIALRMVNATLFRPDATLTPVPDLASEPCAVTTDGVTITCALRAATFHDGSPVTADDVVFNYELAQSPRHPLPPQWRDALAAVEAVDGRTIRFTLARPYAPFASVGLSDVLVLPRSMVEDAYEAFAAASRDASPARLEDLADRILTGTQMEQPDCESTLEEAEGVLRDVGASVPDRRLFVLFRGQAFSPCLYADYLQRALRSVVASTQADGVDAIAAALAVLPFVVDNSKFIGAGPWRVRESDPVTGLVLERHEGYHHGAPVTPEVRILLTRDEASVQAALANGSVDWRILPPWIDVPEPGQIPSTRIIGATWQGYRAIQYNVRPGRLFADRNLRQAIELCIDKERTIEAATDRAVPIYSPIPPGSWAYQPGLAKPRNVDGARELIEASGWQMGAVGIYEQDGRRLSAEVVVPTHLEQPIAFLDRAAVQVRECGIELKTRLVEFREALGMLEAYPHVVPGTSQPFDAYLGGWGLAFDPDQFGNFHSSRASTEAGPEGFSENYIGFSNAEVDRLLEEGVSTYGLEERREIYRQLQRVLAEEQPYYFMWAEAIHTIVDEDLTSQGAPPDFTSHNWWWQLEALSNPAE
jgi:peptide/nickel transport system substrate-binding protein